MSVTDSGQGVSHLSRDMDRNTEDMDTEVKKIEDLSLNAWPSWQMQVYDGWILRYSSFYTHRTNCVEQIGEPHLPLSEKVPYCEAVYRRWKTPCVFKISPVGSPDLDAFLAARGYVEQHRTTVMTRCLDDTGSDPIEDSDVPLTIENNVSHAWMEGLFSLKHMDDVVHRRIVPAMYDAIPKDEIAVSVRLDGRVVATGLGILDRDYIGVYAVHVDEAYRRRGFATQIVRTVLREGRRHGAGHAYLQVVSDNAAARSVYEQCGFHELFRYWFRVKNI